MPIDIRPSRRVQRRAAIGYAGLMGVVAVFQAALVAGAPWGAYTQGGGHPGRLPAARRGAAAASIVLVSAFALGVLALQDIGPFRRLRPRALQMLQRATLAYGVASVPMNLFTPSAVERRVWGPFTVVTLLTLLLAQPTRPAV